MTEAASPSSLIRRVASALVLIPVAVGVLYAGGWALVALVAIAGGLMIHEWLTITQKSPVALDAAVITAAVAAVVVVAYLWPYPWTFVAIAVAMAVAAVMGAARRQDAFWPVLGVLYVAAPAASIIWVREHVFAGLEFTMALFVAVWATDIGAYFAGRALGGPKLAARISPSKTWSGLLGGMALAAMAMAGMGAVVGLGFNPLLLLIGAAVAVLAQMGDLAESALKRRFGVKDSGSIIPGHGGILDRVDGLVLVFPAFVLAYFYF